MSGDGTTEILVTYYLWAIISPVLIIFGTIGNLMCVAVMCRRSMRASNASVYLIALSLADTCVLYTGLLRHFVRELWDIELRNISDLSCRINSWMVYVALDTSVWILVAFTFERILSVFVPHKVKSYCTRLSSVFIIIGVLVAMMAINGHILYGLRERVFKRRNNTTRRYCSYVSQEYDLFFGDVFPWLDFSVYSCVPFFILIIGNSCIATRVILSRRKTRKVGALDVTQDSKLAPTNTTTNRSIKASKRAERTSSMTTTLLILNCVFLITTTPVSIYFIVRPKLNLQNNSYNSALVGLVYAIVNLVMYINNSVNFILYCVTGSRFRKELFGIFKKHQTRVLERSAKSGQDEDPTKKSSQVNTQVPGTQTSGVPFTQTSGVPFTLEHVHEQDTLNLTSLVTADKDEVNITSPVISDNDTVKITSPAITDKGAGNITSPEITDIETVDITSPVVKNRDTVNITPPVIIDRDTNNLPLPVILDKDTVNISSSIITDADLVNNTCPVISDNEPVLTSSSEKTEIDMMNITSSLTATKEIVNISSVIKDNLKTTLQLNNNPLKCISHKNTDDTGAINLPILLNINSNRNTSSIITYRDNSLLPGTVNSETVGTIFRH